MLRQVHFKLDLMTNYVKMSASCQCHFPFSQKDFNKFPCTKKAMLPLVYRPSLCYYLSMSKKTKIIAIIGAAVFVIALVLTIILLSLGKASGKLSIAFYGLEESQEASIRDEIKKAETDKISYTFQTLDSTTALLPQVKESFDLIIAPAGRNADFVASSVSSKKSPALPNDILKGSSVSIRSASVYNENKKIIQIPFLIDNTELLVSTKALRSTGTQTIQTWSDIEDFTEKAKEIYPSAIVFAGSDSDTLFSLITALTEAYSGKKACDEAREQIREFLAKTPSPDNKQCFDLIKEISENPDTPLYTATQVIARWHKGRLTHPNVFQMTKKDVEAYLKNDNTALAFMSLSDHRKIDTNTMSRYTCLPRALNNGGNSVGFFPSVRTATGRNLVSPLIMAIPLTPKKLTKQTVEYLVSTPVQESLSAKTGLSPVLNSCQIPDIQADDVRFFVAATNAPVQPLGNSAFTEKSVKDMFAKELSGYIISISF